MFKTDKMEERIRGGAVGVGGGCGCGWTGHHEHWNDLQWSEKLDTRPHRRCALIVQSYSPGGINVFRRRLGLVWSLRALEL